MLVKNDVYSIKIYPLFYTCPVRGKGGLTVTCPPEETVTVEDVTTFEVYIDIKGCSRRLTSSRFCVRKVTRCVASLSCWGIVRLRGDGVVVTDAGANDGIEAVVEEVIWSVTDDGNCKWDGPSRFTEGVMEGRDELDKAMTVGFA